MCARSTGAATTHKLLREVGVRQRAFAHANLYALELEGRGMLLIEDAQHAGRTLASASHLTTARCERGFALECTRANNSLSFIHLDRPALRGHRQRVMPVIVTDSLCLGDNATSVVRAKWGANTRSKAYSIGPEHALSSWAVCNTSVYKARSKASISSRARTQVR